MRTRARHIATITRLTHLTPTVPAQVRGVRARMGLLASQLAADARTPGSVVG